jgi:hypothetical protein
MTASSSTDPAALRAEHDALARQLEIRRSVDHVRRGAYVGFVALIAVGLSGKLAWDRWGTVPAGVVKKIPHGPPLFFILAVVVTVVLAAVTARCLARAARERRQEDELFARFRALREALRLDG